MDMMNRPVEVFLQDLPCTEDAIYLGRINTSLACTGNIFWDMLTRPWCRMC